MRTNTDIKSKAISLVKAAKKDKKIPQLAKDISFENMTPGTKNRESWFYKIASGKITPSLERSLDIINHFEDEDA